MCVHSHVHTPSALHTRTCGTVDAFPKVAEPSAAAAGTRGRLEHAGSVAAQLPPAHAALWVVCPEKVFRKSSMLELSAEHFPTLGS